MIVKDGDSTFTYLSNGTDGYNFSSLSPASCITATVKALFNCSTGDQFESVNTTADLCTCKYGYETILKLLTKSDFNREPRSKERIRGAWDLFCSPPSVFYDPQLQIICCYIARYYVRK